MIIFQVWSISYLTIWMMSGATIKPTNGAPRTALPDMAIMVRFFMIWMNVTIFKSFKLSQLQSLRISISIDLGKTHRSIFLLYFKGGGLDGPHCRRLLYKLDQLMEIVPLEHEDIVECLFYFLDVCVACFSEELHPGYAFKIAKWFNKYKELNISVTPKVHLLGIHVPQFLAFYGKAMGIFSEQVKSEIFIKNFQIFSKWNSITLEKLKILELKLCILRCRSICWWNFTLWVWVLLIMKL